MRQVNNAAIEERGDANAVGPVDVTADLVRKTFDTNVFGTERVLHAFLPLVQRSSAPVVVNVSSGLGSLTVVSSMPADIYLGVAYPASKAAVNMITVQYAKALPHQRGRPRLHEDRSQRQRRYADRRGGRRGRRAAGAGRPRRPDRWPVQHRGQRAVVKRPPMGDPAG